MVSHVTQQGRNRSNRSSQSCRPGLMVNIMVFRMYTFPDHPSPRVIDRDAETIQDSKPDRRVATSRYAHHINRINSHVEKTRHHEPYVVYKRLLSRSKQRAANLRVRLFVVEKLVCEFRDNHHVIASRIDDECCLMPF